MLQNLYTISFYFNLLSTLSINAFKLPCVHVPEAPLHGSLVLSGRFDGQLICTRKNKDLPLNAPGDDGRIICIVNPVDDFQTIDKLKVPECLPRRPASTVKLPIYISMQHCNDDWIDQFKDVTNDIQSSLINLISTLCSQCSYSPAEGTDCLGNKGIYKMSVISNYYQNRAYPKYTDIRDKVSSWANNTTADTSEVSSIHMGRWEAVCDEQVSAGTFIEAGTPASCRGCPQDYMKAASLRKCVQCPFGQYTAGKSFQNHCTKCPYHVSDDAKDACFNRRD